VQVGQLVKWSERGADGFRNGSTSTTLAKINVTDHFGLVIKPPKIYSAEESWAIRQGGETRNYKGVVTKVDVPAACDMFNDSPPTMKESSRKVIIYWSGVNSFSIEWVCNLTLIA